jgi:hypothetical protein
MHQDDDGKLSHLAVSGHEWRVEIDSNGMVDMSVSYGPRGTADSETARRSPRQWMDLLRASVAQHPIGTFCCPICGSDEPHSHGDLEKLIETVARPAFETYMHRQHQNPCSAVSAMFKRGYWLGYPASDQRARSDGGWAERESRTGRYKSVELQSAWTLWLASWMAIAEFRKALGGESPFLQSADIDIES